MKDFSEIVFSAFLTIIFTCQSEAAKLSSFSRADNQTSTNTTNATVITQPPLDNIIDAQIKTLVAVACLVVSTIVGFIIAKIVDSWWDRNVPPDNASDCSDRTRELLKARFAVFAFEKQDKAIIIDVVHGGGDVKVGKGNRDSKGFGKLWMLRAGQKGKKEKLEENSTSPTEVKVVDVAETISSTELTPYVMKCKGDKLKGNGKFTRSIMEEEFVDVECTHCRVKESATIQKCIDPSDIGDRDNPNVHKYIHVTEDALIPVKKKSPIGDLGKKPSHGEAGEILVLPNQLK